MQLIRIHELSYRVFVQCLSQMLYSFSTDIVPPKVESGECLYESLDKIERFQMSKSRCVLLILGAIFDIFNASSYSSRQVWKYFPP
jgi:hypothetical protein